MPNEATETEKQLMKGNKLRLVGISRRQGEAAARDYFFTAVVVIGLIAVIVLAIAAVSWWL